MNQSDSTLYKCGIRRALFSLDQQLAKHAVTALRVSIGAVFLWFGALKFFPNLSPAEPLALRTLGVLSQGMVPDHVAIALLASLECIIGLLFVTGRLSRIALPLLFLHMLGTALPFLFFPRQLFTQFPYAPTFEAQYVVKNVIIVCAALVIRATLRRGGSPAASDRTHTTHPTFGAPRPTHLRKRSPSPGR